MYLYRTLCSKLLHTRLDMRLAVPPPHITPPSNTMRQRRSRWYSTMASSSFGVVNMMAKGRAFLFFHKLIRFDVDR
jgi:hypothetical protein